MRIPLIQTIHRTRRRPSSLFLLAAAWLWGGCLGAASAAEDHGSVGAAATAVTMDGQNAGAHGSAIGGDCRGPSSPEQCLMKSSTLDEVDDDDVLEGKSQVAGDGLLDLPDILWVFIEPGMDSLDFGVYLESAETNELLIETLVLPEK